MPDTTFKGQVVIITGASSGIGAALACLLADQGACLALAARSAEKLDAVARECERRGGKAIAAITDVSGEAQCKRLIEHTVQQYDRIDMLVNNAGFSVAAPFGDLPDLAAFKEVIDTNFMGSVYCTYYALPYLKKSRGRIVAISSLAGKTPLPFNTAYTASKHAMAGFYDSLRVELADSRVTVTVVYPDFVVTGFVANTRTADGRHWGDRLAKRFYTDKMMTADTCARLILKAAARRRRELTTSTRGKLAGWIKAISPRLLDRIARESIRPKRSRPA